MQGKIKSKTDLLETNPINTYRLMSMNGNHKRKHESKWCRCKMSAHEATKGLDISEIKMKNKIVVKIDLYTMNRNF